MSVPIINDQKELVKVGLLTASFFCIVGAYTVLREMRDILFVSIVGCEYLQYVQILSMIFLIPSLLIYSALVDGFKKQQVLYIYSFLYACGSIVIGLCVIHPTIGLINTRLDAMRIFGWAQYLFIEGYAPFVISLFLAYLNSVTPPQSAAKSYSYVIAGSKLGGMVVALFSWWFLQSSLSHDIYLMSGLLFGAALLLLMVPLCISLLVKLVPESHLHGYEASYQIEQSSAHKKISWYASITSGLALMFRYPYVFGIFSLVFFWEVMSVILNYKRLGFCVGITTSVSSLSSLLFLQMFWIHVTGFLIALIGTRVLLALIGERWSILVVPLLTGIGISAYFLTRIPEMMFMAYIFIRALNFSLAIAVREVLFIPTTKEVRFKTKSWIDAFGTKFARGAGSCYTLLVDRSLATNNNPYLLFCLSVTSIWMITAYQLGKRYEQALKLNEVIGS